MGEFARVAIYGNSKWSVQLKYLLEGKYSELLVSNAGMAIQVTSFVVEQKKQGEAQKATGTEDEQCSKDGIPREINFDELKALYETGEIVAVIIPKEYYITYNAIMQQLIKCGINLNDIYNSTRMNTIPDEILENDPGLIVPFLSDSYLSYLEYHVADHCNLNCKYCTHYSPLVQEPVFTDLEKFKLDLQLLKERIDDIGVIRILGGEPLLNPQLSEFITYTRRLYPKAVITVVTNGLLIDRIDHNLIETMQRELAFFHISYYPPLEKKIGLIKQFLGENKIPFTISPKIEKFNKTQILTESADEDFFYSCFQATCTCLHDGKLSPCYAPFTTKYFNRAFGKELPENEGIDLRQSADMPLEDLKCSLLYPLERCKYCIEGKLYDWEVIGKNSKLEDWIEQDYAQ